MSAVVADATALRIGIAEIPEDLQLPATAGHGIADDSFELLVLVRLAFLERHEIDVQFLKRTLAIEHVDGAAPEGRDIVEARQFPQFAQRAGDCVARHGRGLSPDRRVENRRARRAEDPRSVRCLGAT